MTDDWLTMTPYRITSHWWYRWQSEHPDVCIFARRGRTARAARRRMARDVSYAYTHWTGNTPGVSRAQRRRIRNAVRGERS